MQQLTQLLGPFCQAVLVHNFINLTGQQKQWTSKW